MVSKDLELQRYDMDILITSKKPQTAIPNLIASKVEDFDVFTNNELDESKHVVWTLSICGKVNCVNPKRSILE